MNKDFPFNLISMIINDDTDEIDWIVKNFDSNLNYLFEKNSNVFTKYEQEILLLFYKEYKSIDEIACLYNFTSNEITNILAGIIRKLQYPGILKYLIYGKDVEEKINDLRNNKKYYIDNYEKINFKMTSDDINTLIKIDCEKNKLKIVQAIKELNLPIRLYNKLARKNINMIADLIKYSKDDLLNEIKLNKSNLEQLVKAIKDVDVDKNIRDWVEHIDD